MELQQIKSRGVTWQSVITGLLLIPLNSYWIVMMELIHNSGRSTVISLFFTSILTLLFLLFLNFLLQRLVYILSAADKPNR